MWEAAVENFDWGQPNTRGWNPCFRMMDDGNCCGRAAYWAGHDPGGDHKHISLKRFINDLLAAALERRNAEIEALATKLRNDNVRADEVALELFRIARGE